jgi:hypothetical protein
MNKTTLIPSENTFERAQSDEARDQYTLKNAITALAHNVILSEGEKVALEELAKKYGDIQQARLLDPSKYNDPLVLGNIVLINQILLVYGIRSTVRQQVAERRASE